MPVRVCVSDGVGPCLSKGVWLVLTLAGVIEIVKYTFEISETRGMRGAGAGTAQKKTGCIVSERISTKLGCDVDRE